MPYSLLAHAGAQGTANAATTPPMNTTGATLLALWVASYEGAPPPTITDSFDNVWVQLQIHFGSTSRGTWFFCDNPAVGANHTFTVAGTNSFPAIGASAWSGPQVSVADAASGTGTASYVTTAQPGSVTPTAAGDLCLFGLTCAQAGAPAGPTIDSGFTVLDSAVNVANTSLGMAHAYMVQSAPAPIDPKFTWTPGSDEACAIVCIKAVSSGGSGNPPPAPTLTITDKGDGTGATATINGGDDSASNAVYVASLPASFGTIAFSQDATIAGNASTGITLTDGSYLAFAVATENSLDSPPSNEVYFRTTGGAVASQTLEEAIVAYLKAVPGITAQAAGRVYPAPAPEDPTYPLIVYQRISTTRVRSMSGPSQLAKARIQVNAHAQSYAAAKTLADELRNALDCFQGTFGTVNVSGAFLEDDADIFDIEPENIANRVYGVRMDFIIGYQETLPAYN